MSQDEAVLRRLSEALSANPSAEMTELARAAGMSRATLHRRFGNRTALLSTTARFAVGVLAEAVAPIGEDGEEHREVFVQLFDALVHVGPMYRFLGHVDPNLDPGLSTQFGQMRAELVALIVEAQEAGVLRAPMSAWWVSELFDSLVWMAWAGIANGELARNHAAAQAFDTFWRAVGHDG